MALNFPSTAGQATDGSFTHTESGVTWAWDGITWKSQAGPAGQISSQDVTEWNTAYGWGDHGSAGYLTSYTETQTLDAVLALGSTTTRDITTTGKIYYSNNFSNSVDLPNATTHHGMFAHVHAEGHGYFAHGGAWTQLLDTGSNISELVDVSTNSPSTNDVLTWDGSSWAPSAAQGGTGGGSMDELVDDTTPQLGGILDCNGFSIDFGNNTITDTDVGNWDTAYSWGDHAAAGYLTSYTPSDTLASVVARGSSSEGDLTVNGNLYVSDGSGPSSSHRLYNSSDDLIIQNSTGSGRIRATCRSGFEVIGGIYSNKLIDVSGGVSLYKDNGTSGSSVKLSTSSDGISIYGGLELTSGDITLENGSKLRIEDSPSGTSVYVGYVNASQGVNYDFSQFDNFGNVLTAIHTDGSAFFTNITAAGLTYPSSDGQSGQFLHTDGSGNLSWQSANSGGGGGGTSLGSRQIFSGSTSNSHANNTSENLTIAAYKGYALYKVSVSEPSWVTLYVSSATRTSDVNRAITEDPTPGSGILAEAITQSSSETVLFTPALIGYNDDSTPGTNIYLKVVNKSGSTQSINVDLTVTQLEA